jgi:hypothetical protein
MGTMRVYVSPCPSSAAVVTVTQDGSKEHHEPVRVGEGGNTGALVRGGWG